MTAPFVHRPVMADEVVELFRTVPPGVLADLTVGGGGHARRLLESRPDIRILGVDRDPRALAAAAANLELFGDRVTLVRSRFDHLEQIMSELAIDDLSGALFDLGVSSPQLDDADRGFSYRHDAPLDMRMDPDEPWSAADVVNGYEAAELAHVLAVYGDERFARRIADAIVAARPIETTAELAAVVAGAIPAPARRRGGHPARRTFQAIRIEVNRELDMLPTRLDRAIEKAEARRPRRRRSPTTRARTGSSRIASARPRPAGAPARRACRACAAPSGPSACVGRGAAKPTRPRSPPTGAPSRPACAPSRSWPSASEPLMATARPAGRCRGHDGAGGVQPRLDGAGPAPARVRGALPRLDGTAAAINRGWQPANGNRAASGAPPRSRS